MTKFYTVTFTNSNSGAVEVSRYFQTLRGARHWTNWLINQSFVASVSIYRGQAGAELLETKTR